MGKAGPLRAANPCGGRQADATTRPAFPSKLTNERYWRLQVDGREVRFAIKQSTALEADQIANKK